MEIYKTPSAIILILSRELNGKKQILLQRRQNTGFADGLWDFSCAGKVEKGETMTATAVREAREELGVEVAPDKIHFICLVHKRDESADLTYINAYFICSKFEGEPTVCEKEKCSELRWFDLDGLPDDLIDDRRQALNSYFNGINYIEYGWKA